MVQASEDRSGGYLVEGGWRVIGIDRAVSLMGDATNALGRARMIVKVDKLIDDGLQVPLAEEDDVIETLLAPGIQA